MSPHHVNDSPLILVCFRIEHSKLEFTLTLTIRRDSHITAQAKSNASPPAAIPVALQPPPSSSSSRGGVRGFFGVGSSPKKTHKVAVAAAVRATPEPVEDNIARYVKPDGTLARAFVSFKEIAKRCDTRLFETSFPLIGQRTGGSSSHANPWTMGEIVLQIFRLPPLPGIESDKLPQSLEECHRGLRHINWHKVTYHEGILTQNGGDCRVSYSPFIHSSSDKLHNIFLDLAPTLASCDWFQPRRFQRRHKEGHGDHRSQEGDSCGGR